VIYLHCLERETKVFVNFRYKNAVNEKKKERKEERKKERKKERKI